MERASQSRHRQVASSIRFITNGRKWKMATQLCQKCKQAHPGRACDYDEKGECAETIGADEVTRPCNETIKDKDEED
jgi:hypothetical protein